MNKIDPPDRDFQKVSVGRHFVFFLTPRAAREVDPPPKSNQRLKTSAIVTSASAMLHRFVCEIARMQRAGLLA